MKSTNSNSIEESAKIPQSKSNKKSTKPRTKSSKTDGSSSSGQNAKNSSTNSNNSQSNMSLNNNTTVPTTPTTSTPNNTLETSQNCIGGAGAGGIGNGSILDINISGRTHSKSYAGLEGRSVKIIWEQHDQSDVELSAEVCARVAEDASYKLWELINSIKTYARHSGGVVTYDLVNEVLADADVPPTLGAMDSEWDRIDYDGSYYFYSDKIIELRDEYQKEVSIRLPNGPDFKCTWPVDDKQTELLKKYIPNLIYVAIFGEGDEHETALNAAAFSTLIGASYRLILVKIIEILAFKQNDSISVRCWQLLRACAVNSQVQLQFIREDYFHLTEILISQLLAPYESIKVHSIKTEMQSHTQESDIKMEVGEVKLDLDMKAEYLDQQDLCNIPMGVAEADEKIYKLQNDDDDDKVDIQPAIPEVSPYFAGPVNWKHVDVLCETIGQLAATSGYFKSECIYHIRRRLQRFFEGRNVSTERDFNYISRAVRGLIALGEYAFREFIPFLYKFDVDKVPETVWTDFALGGLFVRGNEDIFLYEWLEYLCGGDKLQPFLCYYAQYYEKFLTSRYLQRKTATFKICSKQSIRRLEWNTLAAAMCHGDDPNKALNPKPKIEEVFPELVMPNLKLNRAGTIRFKFAGCRPVIIKTKTAPGHVKTKVEATTSSSTVTANTPAIAYNNILIARRKLFKPLTNERRIVELSSYYYARV